MTDDLSYIRQRIPDYREYEEERARSDSDMRVRAYLGSRLTAAQTRLGGTLDDATTKALDDVLMRCMFSDQVFVRKFEHARLDATMIAALVKSDRTLIELGQRIDGLAASELKELVIEIDKEFEYRRAPEPVRA
jgi:hypothetical protein